MPNPGTSFHAVRCVWTTRDARVARVASRCTGGFRVDGTDAPTASGRAPRVRLNAPRIRQKKDSQASPGAFVRSPGCLQKNQNEPEEPESERTFAYTLAFALMAMPKQVL